MNEKQKLIMNIAQELFHERGFQHTSIEDIVRACKISKATFYKYFSNKEVLIYEIIAYSNSSLHETLTFINSEYDLNGKEKLEKKIIRACEHVLSETNFSVYITSNFSLKEREPITRIRKRNKIDLLEEYHVSLVEAYGSEISPIIWDLIFILDSLIHEFILVIRLNKKQITLSFIGSYIVKMLDLYVSALGDNSGIIEKSIFYSDEKEEDERSKKDYLLKVISNFNELVDKNTALISSSKLKEAIGKLYIEVKEGRYDSLMLDAMLAFLEKEASLKSHITLVNNLIDNIKEENL